MSWKFRILTVAIFCSALAACGDDDAPPTDMGVGLDLNTPPVDLGPPVDGGPRDLGTPAGDCDPYTAGSCPAGEKCSVVLRNGGMPTVTITFECVPQMGQRVADEVCPQLSTPLPGGGAATTYDLCEQGTFCWDTPGFPLRSCRKLCGAEGVFCGDTEYCALLSSDDPASAVVEPTFGVCTPAAGCDPVFQTGCTASTDACYVISSTRGDLLGECIETDRDADAGTPFAPGAPCMFTNQCAPGSGCLLNIAAGAFMMGPRTCREYCAAPGRGGGFGGGPVDAGADVDAGDVDAGPPALDAGPPAMDAGPPAMDAGPPRTGMCPPTVACIPFPLGDPDAGMPIRVPTDPGVCQ